MRMKICLGIFVFVFAFGTGIFTFWHSESATDIFVSPNGTYRIEFWGDKGRASFFSLGNSVNARIFTGQKLVGDTTIHMGDFMDSSFDLTYQKFVWHNEKVFGLHGIRDHDLVTVENGDSLTVTNNSSKEINYLNVTFGVNRFLILNLEPGNSQIVFRNHSMAPEWISGSGQFADGGAISWNGLSFFEEEKKKRERLFRYCLTVNADQLAINSVDLVGENLNPSRITARVHSCGE